MREPLTPNEAAGLPEPAEWAIQLAAQAWCEPTTSDVEMDSRLATVFAQMLTKLADSYVAPQPLAAQATQAASPKQAELVEELPRKITLAIDRFAVSTSRVRRAELEVAILDAIAPATPQQAVSAQELSDEQKRYVDQANEAMLLAYAERDKALDDTKRIRTAWNIAENELAAARAQQAPQALAVSVEPIDSIEVARLWEAFRISEEGQRGVGWLGGPSSSAHGAMFVAFRAGLSAVVSQAIGAEGQLLKVAIPYDVEVMFEIAQFFNLDYNDLSEVVVNFQKARAATPAGEGA